MNMFDRASRLNHERDNQAVAGLFAFVSVGSLLQTVLTLVTWNTDHFAELMAALLFIGFVTLCGSVASYVTSTIAMSKLERDEALEKYNNLVEKNAGKR